MHHIWYDLPNMIYKSYVAVFRTAMSKINRMIYNIYFRVMVFGAGRRVCAGEQLARNRIFLITTSLLQRFVFEPAADDKLPLHDPHTYSFAGTISPQPYQIRAIPRI